MGTRRNVLTNVPVFCPIVDKAKVKVTNVDAAER